MSIAPNILVVNRDRADQMEWSKHYGILRFLDVIAVRELGGGYDVLKNRFPGGHGKMTDSQFQDIYDYATYERPMRVEPAA